MLGTGILRKLRILKKVIWYKTLYFNFKVFPFSIAKKLPVFFYGSYKFKSLSGNIYIEGAVKTGMIGFGQPYELQTRSIGISELNLEGVMVLRDMFSLKDCFVNVSNNGYLEMGHLASLGSKSTLIATNKIIFGTWTMNSIKFQSN